jgi:hypothetical protein
LRQRSALVVIVGMGGSGKTSLAREVAELCLQRTTPTRTINEVLPKFAAVVWVSDKASSGTTTLDMLLNEIAYTLDCPAYIHLEPYWKQREIDRLLRSHRVLLVIDNAEPIEDPDLLNWLTHIPDPSKALMTTRVYRRTFYDHVSIIDLGRMSQTEGRQFIALRSHALHLLMVPDMQTQDDLIAVTGGNPRAIELFLGLAKRTGRSVADLIQTFRDMSQTRPDPAVNDVSLHLFDTLFAASWAHLSPAEQQIMLALALLPDSVADPVLSSVVGLQDEIFSPAIQQLAALTLVETEQHHETAWSYQPRQGLHPLTRQFARAKLAAEPEFAAAAGERWLQWAVEHATTYGGYRPNDPVTLRQIDAEEPILWAALEWAVQHTRYREVVQLAHALESFYYLKARWDKKRLIHEYYIAAATHLHDLDAQIDALTMHIILLSRQGHWRDAQPYLEQLQQLEQAQTLRGGLFFNTRHAQALYHRARGDLDAAAHAWQDILDQHEARAVSARLVAGTQHWLGLCRSWQGQYDAARQLLTASLDAALQHNNARRAVRNSIILALLDLEQGRIEAAHQQLAELHRLTRTTTDPDEEQHAHLCYVEGRLHAAEAEHKAARVKLDEALHLFERMGQAMEAEAAREALLALETAWPEFPT